MPKFKSDTFFVDTVYYLLWGHIKILDSQVNLFKHVHARNDEENSRSSCPTRQKATKSKNTKKKAVSQTQGKLGKSPESTPATSALFVDPVLPSSVEISPQSSPGIQSHTSATQGGNTFPKLKDLVGRLLSYTLDAYTDKDFGEKTRGEIICLWFL